MTSYFCEFVIISLNQLHPRWNIILNMQANIPFTCLTPKPGVYLIGVDIENTWCVYIYTASSDEPGASYQRIGHSGQVRGQVIPWKRCT